MIRILVTTAVGNQTTCGSMGSMLDIMTSPAWFLCGVGLSPKRVIIVRVSASRESPRLVASYT
jgi:hypothetical protein